MGSGIVKAMVFVLAFAPVTASASFINVYGSPTYTPGVGGFQNADMPVAPGGPGINGSGTAAGVATKYDASGASKGVRAIRWDGSGAATELGILGTNTSGSTSAYAYAINTAGTAAGSATKYDGSGTSKGDRAVRWDGSGAASELGILGTNTSGSTSAQAYAINTAGTAAGFAVKYDGSGVNKGIRAVRWDGSAAASELGILGTDTSGAASARAYAINTAGTAAGYSDKYDGSGVGKGSRAVRWDGSGAATELGILGTSTSGVTSARAYAINTTGAAAGSATKYDGSGVSKGTHPVRWDGSGAASELGILGTNTNGFTSAIAYAINTAGAAAGYADRYDGSGVNKGTRAVRWDGSGAASELGILGTDTSGATYAQAYALNDADFAIGDSSKYDGAGTFLGDRAVYWGLDNLAIDLNTLIDPSSGWVLQRAKSISNIGWIAGTGSFDPDGAGGQAAYTRLFSMQVAATVPEPASLGAIVLLSALALRRGRGC